VILETLITAMAIRWTMKFDRTIIIICAGGVYEPAEDSLSLIEIIDVKKGDRVLDMGTGSGIAALHCAKAGAVVTAADINPVAVRCAKDNAKRNSLAISAVQSDLFSRVSGIFDVISFNPPYLPSEMDGADNPAWTGGSTGHEIIERFLKEAKPHLAPGGTVYVILSSLSVSRDGRRAHPSHSSTVLRCIDRLITIKEMGYSIEVVVERRMFFEQLYGLRLKPYGCFG
jgi:release factor glutamine methyltransferase